MSYGDQLNLKTGTAVGQADEAPYFGLTAPQGRIRYRQDIVDRVGNLLAADMRDPILSGPGEMVAAVLRMRRAEADLVSAYYRVTAIPQQVRIEEERVGKVNGVRVGAALATTAFQLAQGIAESVTLTVGTEVTIGVPPGVANSVGVEIQPGRIVSAALEGAITMAQAIQDMLIDDIDSEATIRNLLLQQNQYVLDMRAAEIQAKLATADLNSLLAEIDNLVEGHIYLQESNETKWFYDPALIFEQEEAEIRYETALREYVRQLYVLSQLLAVRWSEPYENPYWRGDGTPETIGGGLYDDFTLCESVFNTYRVDECDAYYAALKAWDSTLRAQRLGGQADIESVISLRQDIVGLSDITWNPNASSFEYDESVHEDNIRRFRALMLANAMPEDSDFWLRLDFPLTYGQLSRSIAGPSLTPVIRAARTDWNIRVTELTAEMLGINVAPGTPNDLYRIDLYQYGKIEIPRFHPRQTDVYPNFLTYNLPLYYPDPAEESISPFQYTLQAGVNGEPGVTNTGVADREPTPFCSRYVLLVFRDAGPLNIQNIEDIKLTMNWRSGIPPEFDWPW